MSSILQETFLVVLIRLALTILLRFHITTLCVILRLSLNTMNIFSYYYPLPNLLLSVQLSAVFIAALVSFLLTYHKIPKHSVHLITHSLLLVVVLLFLLNQVWGGGRPIAATGFLMPGSFLSRMLLLNIPPWARRLIEPWFWVIILLFATCSARAVTRLSRALFCASSVSFFTLLGGEVLLLFYSQLPACQERGCLHSAAGWHYAGSLLAGMLVFCAFIAEIWGPEQVSGKDRLEETIVQKKIAPAFLTIGLFAAAVFLFSILWHQESLQRKQILPLIGVHYYSWFPENWSAGYIGNKLIPPVKPLLGEYSSANPRIFAQHIEWARNAGVDFFIFDWWTERISLRKNVERNAEILETTGSMKFCLLFETLDIKNAKDKAPPGETANVVFLTPERIERLAKHWEYIAKRFMKKKNYLRINGKSVLFVYATRHVVGPVAEAIRQARAQVKENTGVDLYLVADEVYLGVISYNDELGFNLRPDFSPEWARINAFDALTSYNPYNAFRPEYAGSSGAPLFLSEVEELYHYYQAAAATAGITFIPGVLAAYNDRGVRLAENHYVVPRRLEPDIDSMKKPKTFFQESLERWGFGLVQAFTPAIAITSWNEWNEGSQIEPSVISPPSSKDVSPSGSDYTTGEIHYGYGFEQLSTLAEALKARKE